MVTLLTVLTAINCILLTLVVLIQNPKGGGLDSTFGGAAGATQMFGAAKSTDFVEKVTWGLAISLFILCIITAIVVTGDSTAGTVLRSEG